MLSGMDDLFWLALLVVFFTAIVAAVIRMHRRDECLGFFENHHATYLDYGGRTIWGDVRVTPRGVELVFDAPHRTRRGYLKSSALVYDDEAGASLALVRTAEALTDTERAERERQVRRTFRPGLRRRTLRWLRNLFNSIRDAFIRALALFIGQVGHAYEPLLERHLGRRVVVELKNPEAAPRRISEFPGYLVEYTDRFLAVFNIDHDPEEVVRLDPSGDVELEGFRVEVSGGRTTVACLGPRALVIRSLEGPDGRVDLGVALLPGTSARLRRPDGRGEIEVALTDRIDLVCPRAVARVRFGSRTASERAPDGMPPAAEEDREGRPDWHGVAPVEEDQEGLP